MHVEAALEHGRAGFVAGGDHGCAQALGEFGFLIHEPDLTESPWVEMSIWLCN
mgnify:CR=1 FL=1